MSSRLPLVAIVGAPNAGKSTLWNRLVGSAARTKSAFRPKALVSPMAGTTRDRLEDLVTWLDQPRFRLVDTGGVSGLDDTLGRFQSTVAADGHLTPARDKISVPPMESLVQEQVLKAVDGASVVLFLVDGLKGVTPSDERLTTALRPIHRAAGPPSIVLCVNKMDHDPAGAKAGYMADFYGLGVGDPLAISAQHGTGIQDLLVRTLAELPQEEQHDDPDADARLFGFQSAADAEAVRAAQAAQMAESGAEAPPPAAAAWGGADDLDYYYEEDADADYYDEDDAGSLENDNAAPPDTSDGGVADRAGSSGGVVWAWEDGGEEDKGSVLLGERLPVTPGDRRKLLEAALFSEEHMDDEGDSLGSGFFYGAPGQQELKLAVVGRPNVGKSSLVNRLIGESRLVVHPQAGTTRDAVSVPFTWRGGRGDTLRLLVADTAGIRRAAAGGESREELDRLSVQRAKDMILASHAALLVFDAELGLTRGDLQIADLIIKHHKSCVILANKSDLLSDEQKTLLPTMLSDRLPMMRYAPLVEGSALYGQGIDEVMQVISESARWRATRVPRRRLQELFARAQLLRPLPYVRARNGAQAGRMRVLYVLQAPTEAPTFVFHMNRAGELHPSDVKWLENTLRSQWAFTGTPLRFVFRVRDSRRRRRLKDKTRNYSLNARTPNVRKRLDRLVERRRAAGEQN